MSSFVLQSGLNDPFAAVKKQILEARVRLQAEMAKREPSHTMVLEAAAFLLQQGLLSIRQLKRTNVKQGRALMIWAVWLQRCKSLEWIAEGKLSRDTLPVEPRQLQKQVLILIGGAGTGKATTNGD